MAVPPLMTLYCIGVYKEPILKSYKRIPEPSLQDHQGREDSWEMDHDCLTSAYSAIRCTQKFARSGSRWNRRPKEHYQIVPMPSVCIGLGNSSYALPASYPSLGHLHSNMLKLSVLSCTLSHRYVHLSLTVIILYVRALRRNTLEM